MTTPGLYRSPSREYLVRLLNDMRDANGRAQRFLTMYQAELARIQQSVAARAADEEWDEAAQRLVFTVESDNSKTVRRLFSDYTVWRQNAEWHAATLRTEASVYYMLGEEPQQHEEQDLDTPAAAQHTQVMEALTGEPDYAQG